MAEKGDIPKDTGEKAPEFKVKTSLRKKISLLIGILILMIIILVYYTTLKDQREALLKQMVLRGGALTVNLANNSQVVLSSALSEVLGESGKLTPETYRQIDLFELGLFESVEKMLHQEDVIYAYILNPFGEVLAHSDKSINTFDKIKLPEGVKLYKEKYKEGTTVKPIVQSYYGYYTDPKTGKKKYGEIIDISFPLKLARETNSIKTYEGEAHIGMSLEGILKAIEKAKRKLLNIAFFAILLGIAGAFLLAIFISGPVKKIVSAMLKVTEGDLNQYVEVKSKDEIGLIATTFNYMVEGLKEKERIRNTFNKFISEEIAREVLENEDALKLGGDYKEVTMLFADIRGFTTLSEKLEPHEVVHLLNEYLSEMTEIIIKNKGVIDKYVGDEIMAIFGAPIKHENDPELAVKSGVEMLKRIDELNEKRKQEGKQEINMGIGINTGRVIAGNMGSEKRMDYTVIGDNVNVAERICGIAGKEGRHYLLITESTYKFVKDIVEAREIEPVKVKGREEPVKIYEVYSIKSTDTGEI